MTTIELARLARDVRNAQRHYFRTRSSADLTHSKELERKLDRAVDDILAGPSLFDRPGDRRAGA